MLTMLPQSKNNISTVVGVAQYCTIYKQKLLLVACQCYSKNAALQAGFTMTGLAMTMLP